eukprot:CAMPEP_0197654170 /NCGR_PEP_ID=MMETSP1338-20131121/38690_1 /TAXON_ID=43686 ORGANISM="Pelagodinium beii, Strain RCC1491" /NCGR_SAMPLE_ID=MMETSP1338 /ASSEMBLY_ACC=CAM_ASM_000754 /LENGTH=551 /DNA_ID=CAMNT_0043229569 /DNA_START=79 /DNA_END=1731 /DNA_ORIENTATION=+
MSGVTAYQAGGAESSNSRRSGSQAMNNNFMEAPQRSPPQLHSVVPVEAHREAAVADGAGGRPVAGEQMASSGKEEVQEAGMAEPINLQQRLWILLEDPSSSTAAQLISHAILTTILISILAFVLEAEPALQTDIGKIVFFALEIFCTALFTLEYVSRFAVCNAYGSSRLAFLRSPMNVMDLLAIAPFYFECISAAVVVSTDEGGEMDRGMMQVVRSVRLIRIFRIFRLSKYSRGMALMLQSLVASVQPLMILAFFLIIGVTLFSSLLYYSERFYCPRMSELTTAELAEHYQDCKASDNTWDSKSRRCCDKYGSAIGFESILETSWLTIVTMTTVGYGDKAPKTKISQLIGAVTMLSGIVLISLPVAIVGSKFQTAYEEEEMMHARAKLEEQDRKAFDEDPAPPDLKKSEELVEKAVASMSMGLFAKGDQSQNAEVQPGTSAEGEKEEGGAETAINMGELTQEDAVGMIGKTQRLAEHLRRLDRRTTLSGAAKEQIKLILALLEHISVTEMKLTKLKQKDLAMEACLSQEFAALCRQYEAMRREGEVSKNVK